MLFGRPDLLPLLWLVPLLGGLAIWAAWRRGRRLARWAEANLWSRLAPVRSPQLRALRVVVALLAVGAALLAAARPQVNARQVQVERRGISVLAVIDVSLSMEATDVVPSRLDRSKREVRELFDGLRGDKVGVMVFAGSSFLLCPLTVDVGAANLFLDAMGADMLPDPGTNLAQALRNARKILEDTAAAGARAIVVFTDGESHEGAVMEAADELAETGIPVMAVGVGTPGGKPIPVRDEKGGRTGYKKDRAGNVVLSRLDEATLREVAERTGGRYFPATLQGREVDLILQDLSRIEKGELGGSFRRRVEERFQIPAGIAVALLFLAVLLPETRREEETSA